MRQGRLSVRHAAQHLERRRQFRRLQRDIEKAGKFFLDINDQAQFLVLLLQSRQSPPIPLLSRQGCAALLALVAPVTAGAARGSLDVSPLDRWPRRDGLFVDGAGEVNLAFNGLAGIALASDA